MRVIAAVLLSIILLSGCNDDQGSAVVIPGTISAKELSTEQQPNAEKMEQDSIVTPEPSTLALMLLCLAVMLMFSKWSYQYRDSDDLTTRGIDS